MTKAAVLGYTSPVCHKIVREMLQQVKAVYGLDFTTDDRLFADLCVHVQTLKNGIIAPQIQHHVFGDELRNRYPLLGDICHFLKNCLGQECEVLLGKDEEDYLLPFLISAQRTLYQKIRGKGLATVVISHFNGSVTHFLMEQLQKFYGDILDLYGPYPVHGKERANQDKPMLIITTVRMKDFRRLFHAPMLTVSPLLDEEDQARLEHCLTDIKCKLLYPEKKRAIQDYIRPDMIYKMKNKDSLSSVIAAIQDRFYVKKYMVEKVAVDLENDYLAILPNGFVFMYQEDAYITDTVVSLVKLERAISWKHARNIRAIMFMALRPEDRTQLGWFYHLAFELAGNIQLLDSVIEKESLENMDKK